MDPLNIQAIRKWARKTEEAVVFVHGFNGDKVGTWGRFPALLRDELERWDVYTAGYHTSLLPDMRSGRWQGAPEIPELANIVGRQSSDSPLRGYRSLALVGHSMGGLIIQRALIDQEGLADRTAWVALYGTPSAGAKAAFSVVPTAQLKNMDQDGPFILKLREDWDARFGDAPGFSMITVAGIQDDVVSTSSSLKPFPYETWRVVPGGHSGITKPDAVEDPSFGVLRALLLNADPPPETVAPVALAAESGDWSKRLQRVGLGRQDWSETQVVEQALALERSGDRDGAIAFLEQHQSLGPDSVGTLAGRIKRNWLRDGSVPAAERSYDLYQQARLQAQGLLDEALEAGTSADVPGAAAQVAYLAINEAFLEFTFKEDEEKARAMARLADAEARRGPDNVWMLATRAEARLYEGDKEEALALYEKMFSEFAHEERWKHESAARQAMAIAQRMADPDLEARLQKILDPDADRVSQVLLVVAEADLEWADRIVSLAKPLLRRSSVEVVRWEVGSDPEAERSIDEFRSTVNGAGMVLILVSGSLLDNDQFDLHEMPLMRQRADDGALLLKWAHVHPALWDHIELLAEEATHAPDKPIAGLEGTALDLALANVAREFKKATLISADPTPR